ncbi:MAG: VOC family protein [Planctomycetaceae bacterium]|nr:VOC family protein [Planctomycetaceae bacterium]
MSHSVSSNRLVDRVVLQNQLFAKLSEMFADEVPLYDKSLVVNQICNRAICDLLARLFPGFRMDDADIVATSGERHGAIRIGRRDEYRWMCRLFACFAMEPHNYYDMSSIGAKSQPIIATAFRSRFHPEHRVFCSLLLTDFFDARTKERIESLLSRRQVVSANAQALIERSEQQGGLDQAEAESLINECTSQVFKWTGHAHDYVLYRELCDAGLKIAADIACFQSHHLNHLTPNTFCIDIYTSAMKFCLGEILTAELKSRLELACARLVKQTDHHALRLLFRHLSAETCAGFPRREPTTDEIESVVEQLLGRLAQNDLVLTRLNHSGFKDATEGPSQDTPVLLRQDAYKALSEPVIFHNPDGTSVNASHTARFGEIEQRLYATTATGRQLYDQCLAKAEQLLAQTTLPLRDWRGREALYASAFADFPETLPELYQQGLVYVRYSATARGQEFAGRISTADVRELIELGYVRYEGQRYEDFLPISAAGIFASNLNQYGTESTAEQRPVYYQADLESILGREIIDANAQYEAIERESLAETLAQLRVAQRMA